MMRLRLFSICAIVCLSCVACSFSDSPKTADVSEQRAKFVLSEEPENVVTISEIAENDGPAGTVALVGKIGGVDNPWSKGKAEFIMADPIVLIEEESSGHGADCDCKFCQKGGVELTGRVLVRFLQDDGSPVPVDARDLFELEDSQMVVVQGKPEIDGSGTIVMAANGLYVRR